VDRRDRRDKTVKVMDRWPFRVLAWRCPSKHLNPRKADVIAMQHVILRYHEGIHPSIAESDRHHTRTRRKGMGGAIPFILCQLLLYILFQAGKDGFLVFVVHLDLSLNPFSFSPFWLEQIGTVSRKQTQDLVSFAMLTKREVTPPPPPPEVSNTNVEHNLRPAKYDNQLQLRLQYAPYYETREQLWSLCQNTSHLRARRRRYRPARTSSPSASSRYPSSSSSIVVSHSSLLI
jgi:hypothetical protein